MHLSSKMLIKTFRSFSPIAPKKSSSSRQLANATTTANRQLPIQSGESITLAECTNLYTVERHLARSATPELSSIGRECSESRHVGLAKSARSSGPRWHDGITSTGPSRNIGLKHRCRQWQPRRIEWDVNDARPGRHSIIRRSKHQHVHDTVRMSMRKRRLKISVSVSNRFRCNLNPYTIR